MLDEVRNALLLQRIHFGAGAMSPTQALELATLGSARVLGRDDIGQLVPGKAADVIAVGEAEPLDLFYSRAIDWGDDYLVWQDEADEGACLPSVENTDLVGFCNEFDALEGSSRSESGEASVASSPGGQFLYGVWAQWVFDEFGEEVIESDAMARRIWWIDGFIGSDAWIFGQGPQ